MTGATENTPEQLLLLCPSYFLPSFIPSPLARLRAHLQALLIKELKEFGKTDTTYIPNSSETARESITKSLPQLPCFFISCIPLWNILQNDLDKRSWIENWQSVNALSWCTCTASSTTRNKERLFIRKLHRRYKRLYCYQRQNEAWGLHRKPL